MKKGDKGEYMLAPITNPIDLIPRFDTNKTQEKRYNYISKFWFFAKSTWNPIKSALPSSPLRKMRLCGNLGGRIWLFPGYVLKPKIVRDFSLEIIIDSESNRKRFRQRLRHEKSGCLGNFVDNFAKKKTFQGDMTFFRIRNFSLKPRTIRNPPLKMTCEPRPWKNRHTCEYFEYVKKMTSICNQKHFAIVSVKKVVTFCW